MANKIELNKLTQVVHKEQAFLTALNENFVRLQQAINDTVSRTGVVPNQMEEVLDMNGKRIVNVGAAVEDNDALTKAYINELIADVEAAIARLSTLVEDAKNALEVYAAEHIYPVAQAAVDQAEAARDAAQIYYRDTKDLYDSLEGLVNNLETLLAVGRSLEDIITVSGDLTNIDTVAGLSEAITTVSENITEILAASTYADHAEIWAEGTDEEVQALGGQHSAKGWAEQGGGGTTVLVDGETITKDAEDVIQAEGFVNRNTAAGAQKYLYDWVGTLSEYTAQNVAALHPEWTCLITDDTYTGSSVYSKEETQEYVADALEDMLDALYPVGSVFISPNATNPLATLITGSTWTLVAANKALWTGDGTNGNTTIAAGLPDHTHLMIGEVNTQRYPSATQAIARQSDSHSGNHDYTLFGSDSDATTGKTSGASGTAYGNSTTVQPPAYVVNVWRRTA